MSHLIELKNLYKTYSMGSSEVVAVNNISLHIDEGEFVAIMGASGSGKSSLMNILGFLDTPTSGSYSIMGRDLTNLDEDEFSILRNHIAGFIFQQFQLLPKLNAGDNVLLPAIYTGKKNMEKTILDKLTMVGLGHRIYHYPNELSGGEQQRVAIARSMINEPLIVFADEPTGNLDSKSESEIIAILEKLNSNGKTIVMITHEAEVAQHASRIIKMKDGVIVSDKKKRSTGAKSVSTLNTTRINDALSKKTSSFGHAEFADFIRQAVRSLYSHKMRALLSMLGILIGVGAVISMLAIGEGAKALIEENLNKLGTNIITIRPGFRKSGGVTLGQGEGSRLSVDDADSFLKLNGVKKVATGVNGNAQLIYGANNTNTDVMGTGVDYAAMKASEPVLGRFFTDRENKSRKKVAVIGSTVVKNIFGNANPLGKKIKINKISFTVIGVLPTKGAAMMRDQDNLVVIPVKTAMFRVFGKKYIDDIYVEVTSSKVIEDVKTTLLKSLMKSHNVLPGNESIFEIMDSSEMRKTMMSTANTMSQLLGAVAGISLVVGGVGVMNIMLVSVKERTKEIGLRKAIGAKRKDILLQFLIEAVIMTFMGGLAGIILGVSVSLGFKIFAGWSVKISLLSMLGASFFSILIGVSFGIWPAIQASKLKPIEALRYE